MLLGQDGVEFRRRCLLSKIALVDEDVRVYADTSDGADGADGADGVIIDAPLWTSVHFTTCTCVAIGGPQIPTCLPPRPWGGVNGRGD